MIFPGFTGVIEFLLRKQCVEILHCLSYKIKFEVGKNSSFIFFGGGVGCLGVDIRYSLFAMLSMRSVVS